MVIEGGRVGEMRGVKVGEESGDKGRGSRGHEEGVGQIWGRG